MHQRKTLWAPYSPLRQCRPREPSLPLEVEGELDKNSIRSLMPRTLAHSQRIAGTFELVYELGRQKRRTIGEIRAMALRCSKPGRGPTLAGNRRNGAPARSRNQNGLPRAHQANGSNWAAARANREGGVKDGQSGQETLCP